VGGGVAGLSAAIAAAESGVGALLLDDGGLARSASVQAQGGFSAVTAAGLAAGDSVAAHVADTLVAGALHGDPAVVSAVCSAAADHVEALTRWGTEWDRDADGAVALTREAAHSGRRILHVGGDASGAGIVRALGTRALALAASGRLAVRSDVRVTSLTLRDGVVTGVCLDDGSVVAADAVLLASGGISGVYATRTSRFANPGDAAALAWRAGAVIADAEMVQFHPTHCPEAGFMLTEALRGEGAVLRDAAGRRFMQRIDERAELAPRDIVARGVAAAVAGLGTTTGGAWLDAAPIVAREGRGFLSRRFPSVTAALAAAGLDLESAPVPVAPAEHYWMGGVAVDAYARSTVPGLLVAGEAARTGLHGANRLASNSLLEAVHTGLAAVATVRAGRHAEPGAPLVGEAEAVVLPEGASPPTERVRALADAHLGVTRDEAGLREVLRELSTDGARGEHGSSSEALVARLIATAALARPGSLGGHHRSDAVGLPQPGRIVALVNAAPAAGALTRLTQAQEIPA